MKKSSGDEIFRELASRYVEAEGEFLKQELTQIEQQKLICLTPKLDRRIQRGKQPLKIRRTILAAGLLAACLLIVFLTPNLLRLSQNTKDSVKAPVLTASLPERLSMVYVEQDNGQNVYHLADTMMDDVIVTLEKGDSLQNARNMRAFTLEGAKVYSVDTADYQLLTFLKGGIRYTMTCRYEMATLVELAENIL